MAPKKSVWFQDQVRSAADFNGSPNFLINSGFILPCFIPLLLLTACFLWEATRNILTFLFVKAATFEKQTSTKNLGHPVKFRCQINDEYILIYDISYNIWHILLLSYSDDDCFTQNSRKIKILQIALESVAGGGRRTFLSVRSPRWRHIQEEISLFR